MLQCDVYLRDGFMGGKIRVNHSFNMTRRWYVDRNPDMTLDMETGPKVTIDKDLVCALEEVIIKEEVIQEEVRETVESKGKKEDLG